MQGQAVGGDQQDFEKDEQVEQVAGQEGAVDAEQLQGKEHVEILAAPVIAACGIEQDRQGRTAVSSSRRALSRSSTRMMPKGAGQLPSW